MNSHWHLSISLWLPNPLFPQLVRLLNQPVKIPSCAQTLHLDSACPCKHMCWSQGSKFQLQMAD